jgi:ADP-ribosylglycohydrolase
MHIKIAIGDAFGAGNEFRYPKLSKYQDLTLDKYIKSAYPDSDHFAGMYTDDTQMSIGVTELLLSDKEFNKENLATSFVECYKRDPIVGYAEHFQKFLDSINSGSEFIEKIKPTSIRNGAAMRAVPIGAIYDQDKVIEYATINAQLTHDTPKGIASSVTVALMSHFAFQEDYSFNSVIVPTMKYVILPVIKNIDLETFQYLHDVVDMKKFDPELLFGKKHATKGVPCDGMRTVGAVTYILSNFYKSEDILLESVKLGGDTDSVASIALGIGSMHDSVDNLPKFLYDDLTNHKYGRDYLLGLDDKLAKKFPYD